jgi:Protein of unknown function (DUF4011)/AAA domain
LEISAQRRASVERARQAWINRLIDLSRRNNLLYYRPLKWGTLNLSREDRESWSELLRGEPVSLRKFLRGLTEEELVLKALGVWRKALENQEEKGLATMFVALGMATWKAPDGGRNSESPVLLLPVTLEIKGHTSASLSLRRVGPVQPNLVLLHVLSSEFGVLITQDEVLSHLRGREEGETFESSPIFGVFQEKCAAIQDFEIRDVAVLGNFAFQKMAMVRDLQENGEILATSDIIAALAGDSEAKQSIGAKTQNLDPKEFDSLPPQSEFLILDADSSQQCAIAAVLAGQNAVIHGPPGTGKSQTIANLVASLAAAGKRVLFVAEKRAALQVVLKRLRKVGLERLAIDLHGADVSPKRVTEQVAAALNGVRQALPVDCEAMHARYVERRDRLNRHVESLHRRRKPADMSLYELQGNLLRLRQQIGEMDTRWRAAELARIERAEPGKVRDLLREAGALASLFLRSDSSPWNGMKLQDGTAAQQAVDLVVQLSSKIWPNYVSSQAELFKQAGFRTLATLKEVQKAHQLLAATSQSLSQYSPEIFSEDVSNLLSALGRGANGGTRAAWAWCTSGEYRRARKTALSKRTGGAVPTTQLVRELTAIRDQKGKWTELSDNGTLPRALPGHSEARRKMESVASAIAQLALIIPDRHFDSLEHTEVGILLDELAKDRLTPMKLPALWRIERASMQPGWES